MKSSTQSMPASYVATMNSLEEISDSLGAFRERLRVAQESERLHVGAVVQKLEARYRQRRDELA
ncbi:MAG: hypothetical protein E6J20_04255 [Chloroflexi bacterium]|nr:MAG: hypothetical protein E6J20_04255 [Chloroflexota bacterium]